MALTAPEQIWQDDCYYFDSTTGECMRKYVLVRMAVLFDTSILALLLRSDARPPTDPETQKPVEHYILPTA